jgi:hypothetical protein
MLTGSWANAIQTFPDGRLDGIDPCVPSARRQQQLNLCIAVRRRSAQRSGARLWIQRSGDRACLRMGWKLNHIASVNISSEALMSTLKDKVACACEPRTSRCRKHTGSRWSIDRRNAVRNQTFSLRLGLHLGRRNHGSLRRMSQATYAPMPPTSTSDENKLNPGILLTSGLLHCFIQGIIISQAGRYYEDYYHLDTLSMKTYVGSIVVISLYVCHRQHQGRHLKTQKTQARRRHISATKLGWSFFYAAVRILR